MAGACAGIEAFPKDRIEQVLQVNGLDLEPFITGLLNLRAETWAEQVVK
jgi:hypothetical protein